jgi:hypothetical protein
MKKIGVMFTLKFNFGKGKWRFSVRPWIKKEDIINFFKKNKP